MKNFNPPPIDAGEDRHALLQHHDFKIEYRDPGKLIADPNNAKIHTKKQMEQISASILTFGFVDQVIIDERDVIISGHGRVLAALKLRMKSIPTIRIVHLGEAQKRALGIALNKIQMNTGFYADKLRDTLIIITQPKIDLGSKIGFETGEIDIAIDGASNENRADPVDQIEEPLRSAPPITRPGHLIRLGSHLLLCGDALDPESYAALMGNDKAALVLTDVPYNRSVNEIGNTGKIRHPEFAEASGEMTEAQYQTFLLNGLRHMSGASVDGAIVMSFIDWRSVDQLITTGKQLGLELKNICVWVKPNGGMGSMYRSQHELIVVFKNGSAPHINNVRLGQFGRYRTNCWFYAGATSFSRTRKSDLETHPTVKPIAMIADAIKDCSNRNDIVLDPFGGSGTTLLAAERTGRQARLIEIDPYYCDATIARWQKMTGQEAEIVRHADRGEIA